MNRRNFIGQSALAGLSLMDNSMQSFYSTPNYKLGYQLFSVHEDMTKAPFQTLEALKKMGYQDFETYGFDPDKVTYYGHDAVVFKKMLNDLELTVTSGHYDFAKFWQEPEDVLKRFVDQCIEGAKILHKPYITWPWMPPEQRNLETFKRLPTKLNMIAQQITDAGLSFAYHNHGFEFEDHNGQTGYEIILEETDPSLVKIQIDMYWVMHSSKLTPKEWIARYPGRFVMWHIKDMHKVSRDYTELGNGSIDYVDIMPDPKESGLQYYYLEQGGNFAESAMKSAETSAAFFKKHLQAFL